MNINLDDNQLTKAVQTAISEQLGRYGLSSLIEPAVTQARKVLAELVHKSIVEALADPAFQAELHATIRTAILEGVAAKVKAAVKSIPIQKPLQLALEGGIAGAGGVKP